MVVFKIGTFQAIDYAISKLSQKVLKYPFYTALRSQLFYGFKVETPFSNLSNCFLGFREYVEDAVISLLDGSL